MISRRSRNTYFCGVQQGWLFKDPVQTVRVMQFHVAHECVWWSALGRRLDPWNSWVAQLVRKLALFFLFWTSSSTLIYYGAQRFESPLFFRFQMKREEVLNVATPWKEQLSRTGFIVRTLYRWRHTTYWLRARRSRVRIRVGARVFLFSKTIQTGPTAHRPLRQCVSCIFARVKWPGPEFDHSPPIWCRRKEWVELYLCSPYTPLCRTQGHIYLSTFTFLLNVTVLQPLYKSPPLVPVLSHINLVDTLSCYPAAYYSPSHELVFQLVVFTVLVFRTQFCVYLISPRCVYRPSCSPCWDRSNYVC